MSINSQQRPENVIAFRNRALEAKKLAEESIYREQERVHMRTNVAALILAAILVGLGWLLVQKLGAAAKMQDCLMSGRTNCNPIIVTHRENEGR